MSAPSKRLRYQLEWLGLSCASRLGPLLPRGLCVVLARSLGAVASILDRQGRKVALHNLRVAFGDDLSPANRSRVVRHSYQHFAQTAIDLLRSPRLTANNFARYIEFENFEETARGTGPERSIIIAC